MLGLTICKHSHTWLVGQSVLTKGLYPYFCCNISIFCLLWFASVSYSFTKEVEIIIKLALHTARSSYV